MAAGKTEAERFRSKVRYTKRRDEEKQAECTGKIDTQSVMGERMRKDLGRKVD